MTKRYIIGGLCMAPAICILLGGFIFIVIVEPMTLLGLLFVLGILYLAMYGADIMDEPAEHLKPCRYCQTDTKPIVEMMYQDFHVLHRVKCQGCGETGGVDGPRQDAINNWNSEMGV